MNKSKGNGISIGG